MANKPSETGEQSSTPNRRKFLSRSASSLIAISGIGVAAGKKGNEGQGRGKGDRKQRGKAEKFEELVKELKRADDREEYYDNLSKREKKILQEGLKPKRLGAVETEFDKTSSSSEGLSAASMETTYTKRQRVPIENNYGNKIMHYDHTLKWTVDTGANEVLSIDISTDGWGSLFWQYSEDIDPEQSTVGDDGCSSTKSGLFQYCNEIEGYGYCTAELNTRITSVISGFPNGNSSTAEDIARECGRDC